MGFTTTKPSGYTWESNFKTSDLNNSNNWYWFQVLSKVGRGSENKIAIEIRLQVYGHNYDRREYYPSVEIPLTAQVRIGSGSWNSSGSYNCSGKYVTWTNGQILYWTGTAEEAATISVRAQWTSNSQYSGTNSHTAPAYKTTYTITYKANGAAGSDQTQSKTYGHSVTLKSASTYSRAGYALTGWNTAANGTGTHYAAGGSYTANASATLYAEWTPQNSLILSLSSTAQTQGEIALQMDRKVSTYYHRAVLSSGGMTLLTSAVFAESLTVSVPRSWFANFPNDATITVAVSVDTFTDETLTTQVGVSAVGYVSVTADADMKPAVSPGWAVIAAYNAGAVSGLLGYIKGYSKAEATFDSTKVTHATGAGTGSFSVTCQGATVSASPYRTGILSGAGTVSIVCTVTDTRGRTASETLTVSVMDYAGPGVTNTGIWRGDSSGTADDDGTYMRVLATASFTSLNNQNSAVLTVATRPAGGSWSAETTITSGVVSILGGFDADTTYAVRVTVTDALGNTSSYTETVPKRKWAMKFRPNGSGVAFGKVPSADNLFELEDNMAVRGKGFIDLIYPVDSIYLSVNSADPNLLWPGTTWVRIEDRFLLGAGSSYTEGATGGEATHTLTTGEMPSHGHGTDSSTHTTFVIARGGNNYAIARKGYASGNNNYAYANTTASDANLSRLGQTGAAGGGAAHNNMPPYLVVNIWKRTA